MRRIIAVFILLCFGAALCACVKPQTEKKTSDAVTTVSEAVASVNGESITADELAYFKGKLKAQVLNDYLQAYSIEYTPDFWSKELGGKTPEQALNEQALEKCVLAKLQFVMMREKGIYTDISYQGLYNKALAYNEENSGKSGVVGLKSIKIEQFYSYYLDNGVMELRNQLAENEIKPTDQEINDRIAQLKAAGEKFDENDVQSIAVSKLILEKYDKYIAELRQSAEIEILAN